MIRHFLALALLMLSVTAVHAHGGAVEHRVAPVLKWEFDPLVIVSLLVSAVLYIAGVHRMWSRAGKARGITRFEVGAFAGGWLSLVLALMSPLHDWGRYLFSVHMTQHEILMLVSAPLLVLGRPLTAFLVALPKHWSRALGRASNSTSWRRTWSVISHSFSAWLIHVVALWVWHIPAIFEATLTSEYVHAAQHTSFLFTAILFWWAVVHGPHKVCGFGMAVMYMFTTALQSGTLGVLLTFARTVWYESYAHTSHRWGLTALEDQQLGGLIMWIPAGLIYLAAALLFFAGWLRESESCAFQSRTRPLQGD
jgi:putative membrane protein